MSKLQTFKYEPACFVLVAQTRTADWITFAISTIKCMRSTVSFFMCLFTEKRMTHGQLHFATLSHNLFFVLFLLTD